MITLLEELKLALSGDREAEKNLGEKILRNKLSPGEISHIQLLVIDNNFKSNSHAFYLAGFTYHQLGNYTEAIALYEKAIALGNESALNNRGYMYQHGHGGPINYAKAILLYEQAIAFNNPNALNNRGHMYQYGEGGPIDYAKAIPLYEQAIPLGNIAAMNARALMHHDGKGGAIDYSKAIPLFDQAITYNNINAIISRGVMYYLGRGGPIDHDKAIALFDKAITLGSTNGLFYRGLMHYLGNGGPIDYAKAIALFDKAIALNNPRAMHNRALMHYLGQGGPVDHDTAAYLYRKSYLYHNDDRKDQSKSMLGSLTNLKGKYHYAMVTGKHEFTQLIKQEPQNFMRFLAEDDLLTATEKYSYIEKFIKSYPHIMNKLTSQASITLLENYHKAKANQNTKPKPKPKPTNSLLAKIPEKEDSETSSVSPLISIDAGIWLYLVSYLSRTDKASLRLVCQFFLRNVLSSPTVWQQWIEVNELEMFQEQGKRFGWGPRPIYGVFFSPCTSFPKSLPHITALDLSQSDAFFKASSDELFTIFTKLPKQLKYLKLQYGTNITPPLIRSLMQNYPDIYIDCPSPQSKREDNAMNPLVIAKQQGHVDFSSYSSQKKLASIKLWIQKTTTNMARSTREAWHMYYQITLWLEYLALTPFSFSMSFTQDNLELFALLLIDIYLERSTIRTQYSTEYLSNLALEKFSKQEFDLLKNELHTLQLQKIVTLRPIIETLEKIFQQLPQTEQIQDRALIMLYAYNLIFFSTLAQKEIICAAILAVTRYQILKKQEEAWPYEYVTKTKMELNSFKEEYDVISKIDSSLMRTIKTKMQQQAPTTFFASSKGSLNGSSSNLTQLDQCLQGSKQDNFFMEDNTINSVGFF